MTINEPIEPQQAKSSNKEKANPSQILGFKLVDTDYVDSHLKMSLSRWKLQESQSQTEKAFQHKKVNLLAFDLGHIS
jgi:hypothetical protein